MFRIFDMLGRSTAVRALDDALREAGVHPMLVPEPVKLTVIRLQKHLGVQRGTPFADEARMLAYCILGHEQFALSNSAEEADLLDQRMDAALEAGDTLDAKLVLLTLHSGLIAPEVADRIDLDAT